PETLSGKMNTKKSYYESVYGRNVCPVRYPDPRGMDWSLVMARRLTWLGLSAGPSFFRTFRKRGMQFIVLALVVVGTGAVVTSLLAYFLGLPAALATGLYAGALTCTPALAAALDTLNRVLPEAAPLVSVGAGFAY